MKRNIKLIISSIAFIGLGIGIIGAGVNYFFNHSVLGMEQGLAGSTQNSNEANQVCYITPENPDADMTLEDTTEAVLEAQQTTQPETLLGQHTVSLGTCVFQQKKIACWGDSITFGYGYSDEAQLTNGGQIMDISGWTYPDTLQYYTGMDVYNLGVSGETSYEIATREGGLTMFVAKNVTVKAGKSVEISIVDVDGNSVMLDNFNGYGGDNNQTENLVYINDQLFQLEKRNEKLYIKTYGNTQKGNVKLKKGMQVVTQAAHDVNADILVLQMGSNGGWDSYDELIAQYQAMIEKSGTQCYIIIGDTDNPTEAYDSEQYGVYVPGLTPNFSGQGAYSGTVFFENNWESKIREISELKYLEFPSGLRYYHLPHMYKYRSEIEFLQKINAWKMATDLAYDATEYDGWHVRKAVDCRVITKKWLHENKRF